jgi:hypothetical protein
LRKFARRLSTPTNCLALLSRFSLRRFFISFPALDFTEEAFALKLFLQNPEGLVNIVVANKNFQSELLSSRSSERAMIRCALPRLAPKGK